MRDELPLNRALSQARLAIGLSDPNPRVGCVITDAAGAAGELRGALLKLEATVAARRLEALEEKSRRTRLEPEELKEFQQLMLRKARP